MKTLLTVRAIDFNCVQRQRGGSLVVALIALVTVMLAAVSLMRTSDTATTIAGNLAFKQAATVAGDAGLEAAMVTLNGLDDGSSPMVNAAHGFNTTNAAIGYYSYLDSTLSLSDDATWAADKSVDAGTDAGGNQVSYIIQRMCRTENLMASVTDCIFSDSQTDTSSHANPHQPTTGGGSALMRVTSRIVGPRNTISYVQAFLY